MSACSTTGGLLDGSGHRSGRVVARPPRRGPRGAVRGVQSRVPAVDEAGGEDETAQGAPGADIGGHGGDRPAAPRGGAGGHAVALSRRRRRAARNGLTPLLALHPGARRAARRANARPEPHIRLAVRLRRRLTTYDRETARPYPVEDHAALCPPRRTSAPCRSRRGRCGDPVRSASRCAQAGRSLVDDRMSPDLTNPLMTGIGGRTTTISCSTKPLML